MYTVFTSEGHRLVRTFREARLRTSPGDRVIRWANSGQPRQVWQCGDDWVVRKVITNRRGGA